MCAATSNVIDISCAKKVVKNRTALGHIRLRLRLLSFFILFYLSGESLHVGSFFLSYTVLKMDLILRSIQRRPQIQFSMGRKFTLWRYADMT